MDWEELTSVVLYLRLSRKIWVCLLFFLGKDFKQKKKAPKDKINDFHPLTCICAQKVAAFVAYCSLIFVSLVGFCLICVFLRLKSFRKKKKKKIQNCLDTLKYNTPDDDAKTLWHDNSLLDLLFMRSINSIYKLF